MNNHYKILVIDDHQLFLEGLRHLLVDLGAKVQLELINNVFGAIQKLDAGNKYDLLVVDLQLPQMDGFAFLKSLRERRSVTPVAVLSSSLQVKDVQRAMNLGASGFIRKNVSSDQMLTALRQIMKGEIYLPDEIWPLMESYPTASTQESKDSAAVNAGSLSYRQLEVLKLVADGHSNNQIGAILQIGESTVKYHVSALFKHIGVNSRTALVKKSQELRLLETRD